MRPPSCDNQQIEQSVNEIFGCLMRSSEPLMLFLIVFPATFLSLYFV